MQIANVWLELNELKSNVRLKKVTPAEAQVLRKQFGYKSPGGGQTANPLAHVEILKETVTRSVNDEYSRLCRKYGDKLIGELFPGANPPIPATFKEAGFEPSKQAEPDKGKTLVEIEATAPEPTEAKELVDA